MDLKQSLELPVNHYKTVVVLDAFAGFESIRIFKRTRNLAGEMDIRVDHKSLGAQELTTPMSLQEVNAAVDAAIYGDAPRLGNGQ